MNCTHFMKSPHVMYDASPLSYLGLALVKILLLLLLLLPLPLLLLLLVQCRPFVPCMATAALTVSSATLSGNIGGCPAKQLHCTALPCGSAQPAHAEACRHGFLCCNSTGSTQAEYDCNWCCLRGIMFSLVRGEQAGLWLECRRWPSSR